MKKSTAPAAWSSSFGNTVERRLRSATLILAIFGASVAHAAQSQVITEFTIPCVPPCEIIAGTPGSIAAGPDGNLWFTEVGVAGFAFNRRTAIGRITPTGVISQFSITTPNSGPSGIEAGPDGNLWFTEGGANKVGRITTAGLVTEFAIPTSDSHPFYIAAGPDGNLWFTEYTDNQIGRITNSRHRYRVPHPNVRQLPLWYSGGTGWQPLVRRTSW